MRIKFEKGKQREFLEKVLYEIDCPSLRELINRGFDVSYSTLKNYFNESRTLPERFFRELCVVAKFNPVNFNFNFNFLEENWGKVKGGKKFKLTK